MAVRNLQQKLFRAESGPSPSSKEGENVKDGEAPSRSDPKLNINIPRAPPGAAAPAANLKLPPKLSRGADEAPQPGTDQRPYRERLQETLGTQYEGVERHRLDQDEKKDRHWKRWGPYLSDRQWVCVTFLYM